MPITTAQVGRTVIVTITTQGARIECATVQTGFALKGRFVKVPPAGATCASTRLTRTVKVGRGLVGKAIQVRISERTAVHATVLNTTVVFTMRSRGDAATSTATAHLKVPTSARVKGAEPRAVVAAPATINNDDELGLAVPATDLLWKTPEERNAILDQVAATGAKYVRIDVALSQLTWDGPDQIDYPTLDRTVADVNSHGLKMIGLLHTLPKYAHAAGTPETYGPKTQAQRDLFASFSAKMAGRYRGKVSTWEIWNEENTKNFWYPSPNAGDYVNLLHEAYAAIKAQAPEDFVLAGGTGGATQSADIRPLEFIGQVYAAGGRPYFDALAIHAYTNPRANNIGEFLALPDYRRLMDANGDSAKQLWLTESGTQVGDGWATDAQAAAFVPQMVSAWRSVHDHGPMFIFTIRDDAAPGFGLLDSSGKPREALAAWKASIGQAK